MIQFIFQCLYFALPAIVANMAPVLFKNCCKWLAVPIDGGKTWKGQPLFGKNKTIRGFVVGVASAIIMVLLQEYLYISGTIQLFSLVDYTALNSVFFGFLMGFGVLFGDLMESFVKRRLNLKPGAKFYPWDQTDHVIGGLLFMSIIYVPPWEVVLTLFLLALVLHVVIKHLGYWLGISKSKW